MNGSYSTPGQHRSLLNIKQHLDFGTRSSGLCFTIFDTNQAKGGRKCGYLPAIKGRQSRRGASLEKKYWEDKEYSYFSHKKCEFFPCHKGADPDDFNCLFCYCPLYALGDKCGGNFRYNEKGFKDCTNCQLPHKRKNYGYVTGKYQELAEMMQKVRMTEYPANEINEE